MPIRILLSLIFLISACASRPAPPSSPRASEFTVGYLAMVQGPTSEHETLINVMVPRLKTLTYFLVTPSGQEQEYKPYETVSYQDHFYKIEKIHLKGLEPRQKYRLKVASSYKGKVGVVDEREFQTLDLTKKTPRFAMLSCMSDEWKFRDVIDPMWSKLAEQELDFVIFSGDTVYVDSFDFVERKKATERDLWQRYSDSLKRLPFYHQARLVPVFAIWDDHDFGTNDGDREFVSKAGAQKLFRAVFGGPALDRNVWRPSGHGISSVFEAYGQRFYLMDDRSFRQPNADPKPELYGHWGKAQHDWLIQSLKTTSLPAWIINGNQIVNGKQLKIKESLQGNHPREFEQLEKDLRGLPTPFIFASGDIHFSEIMKLPAETFGFQTFEVTSSSMHSYRGEGWDNPLRISGGSTREYNFLVVESTAQPAGLHVKVQSVGLSPEPYFQQGLIVDRASSGGKL